MISFLFVCSGLLLLLAVSLSSVPLLFVSLFFIYKLVYAPTLGLANSIAMAHVENREKFFPIIRIGGTVGWIFAATVISLLKAETTATPFIISGVVSIVSGII
ncbi:nucleoside permease, partial [Photobacterium sanctipauli]